VSTAAVSAAPEAPPCPRVRAAFVPGSCEPPAVVPQALSVKPASIIRSSGRPALGALRHELMQGRLALAPARKGRYPGPMRKDASVVEIRPHIRLIHGLRKPANWLQLVRFSLVGCVGFVVNLAVYALLVHGLGVEYLAANVIAWLVAVTNNFVLNRHWTFDARHGRAHQQAIRFLTVSLTAEAVSLLLLTLFVEVAHLDKVVAQALAVGCATPLNFIGNKLWSFRFQP
jgi:putative flippase GtrA